MQLDNAPAHVKARAMQLYKRGKLNGYGLSCADFFQYGVYDENKDEIGVTVKAVHLSWPLKAWFVENRSGDLYVGPGEWISPTGVHNAMPFDTEEDARKVCNTFTPLMARPVLL